MNWIAIWVTCELAALTALARLGDERAVQAALARATAQPSSQPLPHPTEAVAA